MELANSLQVSESLVELWERKLRKWSGAMEPLKLFMLKLYAWFYFLWWWNGQRRELGGIKSELFLWELFALSHNSWALNPGNLWNLYSATKVFKAPSSWAFWVKFRYESFQIKQKLCAYTSKSFIARFWRESDCRWKFKCWFCSCCRAWGGVKCSFVMKSSGG